MPALLAILTFLIVGVVVLWIIGVGQGGAGARSADPAARKNIYEQQQANRRMTWLVVAIFIAFFAFLGLGLDFFYLGYSPWPDPDRAGIPIPLATIVTIGISSISAWRGMVSGDQAVLRSSLAIRTGFGTNDPQQQQLMNVVEEMCIASGLPMPKVYIIPDSDPNAFATGRDPEHASVAVTRGLLEKLNREELQGVIAHEMSHIRNLDIRLMTTIAALVGAVVLLSDWAKRIMRSGGSGSRRSSKGKGGGGALIVFVIWLVAILLAPFLAQLLAMAVSREREYLADASGAELTRNPLGLASALQKLEGAMGPTETIKRGTAHLCIADPLGRKMGLREGFFADLLATHPPMPKRISVLQQMAYQEPAPET